MMDDFSVMGSGAATPLFAGGVGASGNASVVPEGGIATQGQGTGVATDISDIATNTTMSSTDRIKVSAHKLNKALNPV